MVQLLVPESLVIFKNSVGEIKVNMIYFISSFPLSFNHLEKKWILSFFFCKTHITEAGSLGGCQDFFLIQAPAFFLAKVQGLDLFVWLCWSICSPMKANTIGHTSIDKELHKVVF